MHINRGVTAAAAASVWLMAALARGQAPPSATPRFEVASVKRNASAETRIRFEMPPGTLNAINVPVRFAVRQA